LVLITPSCGSLEQDDDQDFHSWPKWKNSQSWKLGNVR
jgi:hypothetical protein